MLVREFTKEESPLIFPCVPQRSPSISSLPDSWNPQIKHQASEDVAAAAAAAARFAAEKDEARAGECK